MLTSEQPAQQEEQEISLLRDLLPKISSENRAYIKGASEALVYAQEKVESVSAGVTEDKIGA